MANKSISQPTNNEEHFDDDVSNYGSSFVDCLEARNKGSVVRNSYGDVKGAQEDQPVPADLEDAVVEEDQF